MNREICGQCGTPLDLADHIKALEARLAEALDELDDASPMQACDRCGKTDRRHRMVPEEGDEWECFPCWERCNAQERATPKEQPAYGASAAPSEE